MIYPRHEQHYPDKLLPHRIEEFVLGDGRPPSLARRTDAVFVTGQQVYDAVVAAQARLGISSVHPRYFVATCFHESGCLNEWDTEVATASCVDGYTSVGPYQIGREEAASLGFALEDMLDLDKATECMVRLADRNRTAILGYVAQTPYQQHALDYDGSPVPGGGLRAYLAIAHNHGLGYARKTISAYGLDWPRYRQRNPTDNIVAHRYGEDCATGGPNYPVGVP